MKSLKLSLNVHDATTSGKQVILNPDHIVSIRPWIYSSGSYTEISMTNGEKFQVKDTIKDIEKMMGSKKWL
jgi:uncharacterized protein YlzI (FlbEa/FlbD family)